MPYESSSSWLMHTRRTRFFEWLAFIAIYVALDWASYLHALYGLNITPWNPSLAFGLVCWLRFGRMTIIPWFIALILGELLVREMPASLLATTACSALLAAGYSAIAEAIRRFAGTESALSSQRLLLTWLNVVLIGTLATSGLFICSLVVAKLIPVNGWSVALLRFWIGDFVGVFVTMPFFWLLLVHRERLRKILFRPETGAYLLVAAFTLWVVFGLGGTGEFQYFYLLFIPLVWAAARHGMAGAAITAFLLQAGIIVAVQYLNLVAVTVFELQMLGAALAFAGFFIGTIIDEKQRVSSELRQTLHLAAAGEMAGALAHEINQPLSALTLYGAACQQLIEQGDNGDRLRQTIEKMVAESFRAGEVIRRLREFFRTGSTQLETIFLPDIVASATQPFMEKAKAKRIQLSIDRPPPEPLLIDRLQIEVVFRNLLSNAFEAVEAITGQAPETRWIRISFRREKRGQTGIRFEDSGAGLSTPSHLFEPFHSTKSGGLGLGLVISRAIAEAHGGSLMAIQADHGLFQLNLPVKQNHDDETQRNDHLHY